MFPSFHDQPEYHALVGLESRALHPPFLEQSTMVEKNIQIIFISVSGNITPGAVIFKDVSVWLLMIGTDS